MASDNRIGRFFFVWRDKLPVPLALAMFTCARPRPLNWIAGVPLVIAGELIRLWGLMHIGPTTRTREICADRLVTSGPYSHCRNPLYFANFLKIAGFMVIAGNAAYALCVAVFYILEFTTMIPYEETFLAEKFPEAHRIYRESVPVFMPALKPCKGLEGKACFEFAEAVRSERRTFASTSFILLALLFCSIIRKENPS
ncbi:MAG: isoprenylcysteine carboxylmethyltransferase family protein [Erysipelotrichia bacterium]|nr:isoprenylcysteine carboxylmethyltransferase family protein [Erysipelotrichia bacterium]